MHPIWLVNLGTIPYANALALQHRIVETRKRGALCNVLLLLEHPPVFTLGRHGNESNILASREYLEQIGIEVFHVERGGDVTYHGPNQLVGYPIIDLRDFRQDVGWYVRSLEETLIHALLDFGIPSRRIEKLIGVWVEQPDQPDPRQRDAKIVQIGARIEQWITYHGFALNVDPNMAHFDLIVPCGINDKAVTSMARFLNQPVDMRAVRERVAFRFGQVFGAEMIEITHTELEARLSEVNASGVR
jgi:lipoyl(octanoyl) transferase